MEASKEKRSEYLESIKAINKEHLVYIDESGIELNVVKDRGWGKKSQPLSGKKSGKYYKKTTIRYEKTEYANSNPVYFHNLFYGQI